MSEVPGLEADDCIGTLAARGVREGYDVTIASGDKDLEQLLALPGSVRMLKPGLKGGATPFTVDDFMSKHEGTLVRGSIRMKFFAYPLYMNELDSIPLAKVQAWSPPGGLWPWL